jgi:hypothetical protein
MHRIQITILKTGPNVPAVVPLCSSSADNVAIHYLHVSCTPKLYKLNAVYHTERIYDILHELHSKMPEAVRPINLNFSQAI